MKKIFLALSAIITMGLCATAQNVPDEVEIVTDENVKLEMITPAQPVQETEEEVKAREKKLRELTDDVAYAKAANSLRRGYFVLVADNIRLGQTGYRRYDINGNSNFVLFQNTDGIIQYALNTGGSGINGLGGWTGKGQVRNKRIKEKDNGDEWAPVSMHTSASRYTITASEPWPISWEDLILRSTAKSSRTATRIIDKRQSLNFINGNR